MVRVPLHVPLHFHSCLFSDFFMLPLTHNMQTQVRPRKCWEQYRVSIQSARLHCNTCDAHHPQMACPLAPRVAPQHDMGKQALLFGDRARIHARREQPAAEYLLRMGWGPLMQPVRSGLIVLLWVLCYPCAC